MASYKPVAYILLVINLMGSMVVFSGNENMRHFFNENTVDRVANKLNIYKEKSSSLKHMIVFLSFGDGFYSQHSQALIQEDAIELELPEIEKKDGSKLLSWLTKNQWGEDQLLYSFELKTGISQREIIENVQNSRSILFIKDGNLMSIIGYDEKNMGILVFNNYFQKEIISVSELTQETDNFYIVRTPTSFNNAYINKTGWGDCNIL